MVIDMDETRLRKIEQLQQILSATPVVTFKAPPAGSAADHQRYEHISRVRRGLTTHSATSANAAWCWPTCDTPAAMAARS